MACDGLARWSGGLSSPMQPYRGRINVVNLQTRSDGGCSEDLRAMHQRIDIISLLYFEQACQFPLCETGCQARAFVHWRLWAGCIEVIQQPTEGAFGLQAPRFA